MSGRTLAPLLGFAVLMVVLFVISFIVLAISRMLVKSGVK